MARSAVRNQQMRDERRARILSSALELFAAKGLAATTITDIAEHAGMSQGLLYHYFPAKEEIYVELVRGAFARMNEAARALERLPLSPREKIVKAIADLLRALEGDDDFARYFLLTAQASFTAAAPRETKAIIKKQRGVPYDVIARILRAGQRDGSIKRHDADELAVVFWTLIKGLALHRAAFGKQYQAPSLGVLAGIFLDENER